MWDSCREPQSRLSCMELSATAQTYSLLAPPLRVREFKPTRPLLQHYPVLLQLCPRCRARSHSCHSSTFVETAPSCILGSTGGLGTRVHITSNHIVTACHHPGHEQTPVPGCACRHLLWNWELEEPLQLQLLQQRRPFPHSASAPFPFARHTGGKEDGNYWQPGPSRSCCCFPWLQSACSSALPGPALPWGLPEEQQRYLCPLSGRMDTDSTQNTSENRTLITGVMSQLKVALLALFLPPAATEVPHGSLPPL